MSKELTSEKIRELDIDDNFTYTFYNGMEKKERSFIRSVLFLLFWCLKTDSRKKVRALRKAAIKKVDLINEIYGEDNKIMDRINYEYYEKRHCDQYEWWKDGYVFSEKAVLQSPVVPAEPDPKADLIEEIMCSVQDVRIDK